MAFKVFVSNDVSEKGVALLREHFDVDVMPNMPVPELCKIIGEYDALVRRSQIQVTKELIDAATNLKVIGRAGVGVDNIDIPAATARGIVVLNTPEGNTMAATEHTVAMLMAMTRHIPQAHQSMQEGRWDRKSFDGIQVQNRTLGIIGVGRIGSRVAKRMQGMEMTTIGYDPYITEERARQVGVELVDLDTLLKRSDYITIHVPYNNNTKGTINADAISHMKGQVRIINLARGGLVDDDDMIAALESGRVARYVTDFPNHKIAMARNVIALPHLGASTPESEENCAVMAARQLQDYLVNGNIVNSVNMPNVEQEWSGICRLCLIHRNVPGMLTQIMTTLSDDGINVENMTNKSKKDFAYTMVDINSRINDEAAEDLRSIPGMIRVRILNH